MSRIQKINPETAPEEVQKTIREHLLMCDKEVIEV